MHWPILISKSVSSDDPNGLTDKLAGFFVVRAGGHRLATSVCRYRYQTISINASSTSFGRSIIREWPLPSRTVTLDPEIVFASS